MQLKNTDTRYGLITKLLHWTMALLIIGMICVGFYAHDFMPRGAARVIVFDYHKAFGILILFLVILRVIWRCLTPSPTAASSSNWHKTSIRSLYIALYICMFAIPLTGWLYTSAKGTPFTFFGLFTVPSLISKNPEIRHIFSTIHEYLSYALIGLISLHILAALKHHFINKNDTLRRMIK